MSATGWAIATLFFWLWSHQVLHGYKDSGQRWALLFSGLTATAGLVCGFFLGWSLVRP